MNTHSDEKRIADFDNVLEYIEEIWGQSAGSGIQEWHLLDLENYIKHLLEKLSKYESEA